jgi:hypothetical protein
MYEQAIQKASTVFEKSASCMFDLAAKYLIYVPIIFPYKNEIRDIILQDSGIHK